MTEAQAYAWLTVALYVLWVAGASSLAIMASRHLIRHLHSTDNPWGFTSKVLAGLAILGAGDAINRTFWGYWHLGKALGDSAMTAWVADHQWINLAASVGIIVGYWIAALALRRSS